MKVRQFRQMMEVDPSYEDIPTGYSMFRELQRMLMITGAGTRKEVTDDIRSLRQYTYHVKKGHEDVNRPVEESEWPDGWMAANWGPPRMLRELRMPPRRQRVRRRNESSSSEEQDAMAALELQDRGRDDHVLMDEPEPEIEQVHPEGEHVLAVKPCHEKAGCEAVTMTVTYRNPTGSDRPLAGTICAVARSLACFQEFTLQAVNRPREGPSLLDGSGV